MSDAVLKGSLDKLRMLSSLKRDQLAGVLVEEAVKVTGSQIGYFAVMSDDEAVLTMLGWSRSAMGACAMIDKPIVYPIEKTGLWGDAVRQRGPVVTNDYAASKSPTKKGHPEGHVPVVRHLNVPVLIGGKVKGVLGVGNKPADYSDADVAVLQKLAIESWTYLGSAKA